ncbi:hypothetical protein [Pseudoalteromonas sp. 1181_04]|uniref:hypothetical protein n=1 Tax=Pseudoalteromonas sp. 1181_04 TaxID=2604450 RepID=UPI004064A4C0
MTASAGAWYRVGTVNVTSGQQGIVGVGTNWQNDVIAIAIGDIFTVDSKTFYEVTAVNSDTSISLDRNFEGVTDAGINYAIVRNTSGTILTRIAGQVSVQFNQKQLFLDELRIWLNSDNASEELTDSHGVKHELKTPAQMVRDHDDKLAELDEIHPFPWAMRKVEFEARRAANNEKYAASGFVHFGKHFVNSAEFIKEGITCFSSFWDEPNKNRFWMGRSSQAPSVGGASKTDSAILNIAGVITNLESLADDYAETSRLTTVKLPPAEDGTRTYDSYIGVSVTHATPAIAFASETATNKVVTERVDMWGFEAFLREINATDPFVYKYGLIQSQLTDISGVATVNDNVRPITYFAWYEGDESSRGKGVNWQTATEAQRIVIASDPENNIYFDDATGKFYQWCIRGRSFSGAGNRDWLNLDTSRAIDISPSYKLVVAAQGIADYREPFVSAITRAHSYRGFGAAYNDKPHLGAYTLVSSSTTTAINGECYFLVCGTVARINTGLYHPSFNPFGSARAIDDKSWSSTSTSFKSKADCFDNSKILLVSGNYSSGKSGRTDGRYYDVIKNGGFGGVARDMRYGSSGLKKEDFENSNRSLISGTYRGLDNLKVSKVIDSGYWLSSNHSNKLSKWINYQGDVVVYLNSVDLGIGNGDSLIVIDFTKNIIFRLSNLYDCNVSTVKCLLSDVFPLQGVFPTGSGSASGTVYLIHESNLDNSIGDGLYHTDVQGGPAEILLCDDLKNGWVGNWIHDIPDGIKDLFELTRPYTGIGTDITCTYTLDNGATWTKDLTAISSSLRNTVTVTDMPANQLTIWQYQTQANVTKKALNVAPYGFLEGMGPVFISSRARAETARILGYSLISKVLKSQNSSAVGKDHEILPLTKTQFGDGFEKLISIGTFISEHSSIGIAPPTTAASSAFKALSYNVVDSQQAFINYAYIELKHNGTDWGDDSKIHIADNQTTMLDENGNTVLVGTARCVEPLGWIKNDK